MLTFEMERRVIWGRRLTLPGVLFYLNRYLLLAFALIIYLWGFVPWRFDSVSKLPSMRSRDSLLTRSSAEVRWMWQKKVCLLTMRRSCGAIGLLQNIVGILLEACYTGSCQCRI